MATNARKLTEAKRAIPFTPKNVITAEIELEGAQDGLARLKKLEEQLFPSQ